MVVLHSVRFRISAKKYAAQAHSKTSALHEMRDVCVRRATRKLLIARWCLARTPGRIAGKNRLRETKTVASATLPRCGPFPVDRTFLRRRQMSFRRARFFSQKALDWSRQANAIYNAWLGTLLSIAREARRAESQSPGKRSFARGLWKWLFWPSSGLTGNMDWKFFAPSTANRAWRSRKARSI